MQNEAIEPGNKERDHLVAKQVFKPASWLINIDSINQRLLSQKQLFAVLAERGAGKSTFAKLLQTSLDARIKIHVLKALAPYSEEEFLAQLDAIFHFRTDKESRLEKLINNINEQKEHVLVIIDDAQHIPNSILQEILVEQEECGFFHFCLVADFSLMASLSKLEPSNLISTLELGVLTQAETKTYLLNSPLFPNRLDKVITEKRLEQFYRLTGGNIARINSYMQDYFFPASMKLPKKSKSLIRNLSFLATAAIALLASSYIWQNQFLPSSTIDLEEQEYEEEVIAEVSPPLPSLIPLVPALEKEPLLVSQLPDINYELVSRPSQIPNWLVSAVRQQVQPSPKRIIDVALEEETDDSLVVRDRVVVIPKTLHPTKPALKIVAAKPNLIPKTRIIPTPKPNPNPIPGKIAQVKTATRQLTIQLLASRKRDEVMRFVNSHKMSETAKVRLTTRDGLDWYVLTIGEFGQRNQAQTVIRNLPAELAQLNPWIRPVDQLRSVG